MKLITSFFLAASCLNLSARADEITPASSDAEAKAAAKNTKKLEVIVPDSGSVLTQQRMEDDSNDGRSRDAKKRSTQDINLYNTKPSRKQ